MNIKVQSGHDPESFKKHTHVYMINTGYPRTSPAVNGLKADCRPASESQTVANCALGQIHVKGRGEVRGMRPDTVKGAICHCSASHYVCAILHAAEPGCILQGQASHPRSRTA